MLSILNELSLQKELQHIVTKICFGLTGKTQQQQNRKSNIKILGRVGNQTRKSRTPVGCVISGPPRQLKVTIGVKLLNCFTALGQNVNKQRRICLQYVYMHG